MSSTLLPGFVEGIGHRRAAGVNQCHRGEFLGHQQAVLGPAALLGDALQHLRAPHQAGFHVFLRETPVVVGLSPA